MPTSDTIRQQMQRRRQSLTLEEQAHCETRMLAHLTQHRLFQQAQNIGCYLSVKGEMGTAGIIQAIHKTGKACYLPCLVDDAMDPTQSSTSTVPMVFARYHHNAPLCANRYGILEPAKTGRELIATEQLDLVLVPLVAFDQHGNRLGMGAGYYDRTFAFTKTMEKPLALLGIAYQFQLIPSLDKKPWDIPLTGVVTEQGCCLYSPNV